MTAEILEALDEFQQARAHIRRGAELLEKNENIKFRNFFWNPGTCEKISVGLDKGIATLAKEMEQEIDGSTRAFGYLYFSDFTFDQPKIPIPVEYESRYA